jgi:hypothetical protein
MIWQAQDVHDLCATQWDKFAILCHLIGCHEIDHICRGNLPRQSAAAICHGNLPPLLVAGAEKIVATGDRGQGFLQAKT